VFRNEAIVEDNGQPDPQAWDALPHNVQDLPDDVLRFLLASRYCEVVSRIGGDGRRIRRPSPRRHELGSHLSERSSRAGEIASGQQKD
jgi:hypothetical protein